jgi:ankyrin repeat protein
LIVIKIDSEITVHEGKMHLVKKTFITLSFILIACFANADGIDCKNFGKLSFFESASSGDIEGCLQTASKQQLLGNFTNGNNAPMNAVAAEVNMVTLSKILSYYTEDELSEIFKHRNFDELSIVNLASIASNGSRLLIELGSWSASDFNVLKDKKDGSFIASDRGISALHYALSEKPIFENIMALLAMGANPFIQDKKGNIALNYAISNNLDYDTLAMLLTFTDEIVENDKGYNALHFAVQKISNDISLSLIFAMLEEKYHDDVTENDETVLHLAAASARTPELFDVALQYSSGFLCEVDAKGAKAIDYARRNPKIAKSKQILALQNECD